MTVATSGRYIRNLRVVRIDDSKLPVAPKDYKEERDGLGFAPLNLVTFPIKNELAIAICSLETARAFWIQFDAGSIPDIILGDVNFENDDTSPLQSADKNLRRNIPTGLTHCKPFIAISRAIGRPLSIKLHTADKKKWKELLSGPARHDDRTRVFALLAAQESMEIAAMLHDAIPGGGRNNLAPVWDWLGKQTASTPGAALAEAIVEYRRRLVVAARPPTGGAPKSLTLRLDSSSWAELREWCERMRKAPKMLREDDIGLPLLYPDGVVDRISLASLFADVEAVGSKALPSACFELVRVTEPWRLRRGNPQIGALIAEFGELGNAAALADDALRSLPLGTSTLTTNLRKAAPASLAAGLAILFRALQIYRADEARWERVWGEGHWHPTTLSEVEDSDDYDWARPISHWVDMAEVALKRGVPDINIDGLDFVDLETIVENYSAVVPATISDKVVATNVTWHLLLLCELGRAESRTAPDGGMAYRACRTSDENEVRSRPARPAARGTGLVWESDNLSVTLRDSLGFGVRGPGLVNDNAIGQILHDAFVAGADDQTRSANERAKSGRDFWDKFRNGDTAEWIRESCRRYCEEILRWRDETTWPKCIRSHP